MGRFTRLLAVLVAFLVLTVSCTKTEEAVAPVTTVPGTRGPVLLDTPAAAPPEPPSIIPLLRTINGEDVSFGGVVILTSQVMAANPIARLELWVDTEMVDSHDFATPVVDPIFPWEWTADSVGLHAVTVRAFDVEGKAVGSFPSWSRVSPGWDVTNGKLMEGLPVSPLESTPDGVSLDLASCEATVLVAAAPGSLGQAITGTTLGVGGYQAIAVVGEAGGSITVPMAASPVILSVEPYDDILAIPVSPISIPGAPECASGAWAGDLAFNGATLVGADQVDDVYLYVTDDGSTWRRLPETGFVGRGSNGFSFAGLLPPVPAGGFLEVEAWGWGGGQLKGLGRARYAAKPPSSNEKDWGSAKPVQPFSSLNIVRTFVEVVDSHNEVEYLLLQDVVCVEGAFNPQVCGPSPQILRWNANILGAEAGLVQVSTSPPPPGQSLSFPGLVWSTMLATDGAPIRDFPINIAAIREGNGPGQAELDLGQAQFAEGNFFQMADLNAMGSELSIVAEPAAPGVAPRTSAAWVGTGRSWVEPNRFWVRVIPFTNGVPIAGISNAVLFETDATNVPIEHDESTKAAITKAAFDALYDVEVEFSHPQFANSDFSHCVRVISNPFGNRNPLPTLFAKFADSKDPLQFNYDGFRDSATVYSPSGNQKLGLVPGATVCAYKPKPPSKDLFDYVAEGLSFIGQAWDTFKDLIDMVKSGIIKGIVDITGCTPEKTCIAALSVLADVGLASIGVPPSLPSFRELADAAKGDIAAALAKKLVGEACGAIPCEQFAEQFIADALDDIEAHFSTLATTQAQSGGWVLLLNPEIRVIPEPAGQLFPGSVSVRVTRKPTGVPGPDTPTFCAATLWTDGSGKLSWRDKYGDQHTDEVVTGAVFASASGGANLSDLGPGESLTFGVAGIDFDRHLYLKFTGPSYAGYISQEKLQAQELWKDPDTVLVMTASTCGGTFTETVMVNRKGSSPADIPSS